MTYSVEQWGVDISRYPFATLEEAVFQASVAMRWKLSTTALPWQEAWKPYFGFILRLWGLQWLSHWLLWKCVSAFWFTGKTEVPFERRQAKWPESIPSHLNNNTMLLTKIWFSVKYSIATCPQPRSLAQQLCWGRGGGGVGQNEGREHGVSPKGVSFICIPIRGAQQ